MDKLNRPFTKKEVVLILALAVILLAMVYYRFVYVPVQDQISALDTTALEDQIQAETIRAQQMKKMQAEISQDKNASLGEVATYDNQKNELNELNDIFQDADTFNLNFEQPVASDNIVRRNISITFTASGYDTAEKIISSIYSGRYRCLISDLDMQAPADSSSMQTGEVSCSMSVTFYETLYHAATKEGLIMADSSSDSQTESGAADSSAASVSSTDTSVDTQGTESSTS
ncbi:MAG: hypothetical protein PUE47_05090 [Lachnospiraceae bacterium]|nr:hypothetical protein [Lachnospiraceae bacterium]